MTQVRCLVCGSTDTALRHEGTFAGTLADAPDYFLWGRKKTAHGPIRTCRSCGFVFTAPQFAPAEYDTIYAAIGATGVANTALTIADQHRFARIARLVRATAPPGGHFIDFGCGSGAFLAAMDDPNGRGFEIGPPGNRMIGSIPILTGRWRDVAGSAAMPPASLDYLVTIDVLEHLPELREDLAAMHRVIKPGGRLYVTVPDISSPIARLMGKRWSMILLEHLWYFSPRTLARLLMEFGFEMQSVRSLPYDAPVSHILTRLCQTFGMPEPSLPSMLADRVIPVPAGVLFADFIRR